MKIETDKPLLQSEVLAKISHFWDTTSTVWQTIWGPHIHHGYYDPNNISSSLPPEILLEKLMEIIHITPNQKIVDVGCGLGETTLYLSQHYPIKVTGINLSDKQLEHAKQEAMRRDLKATFIKDDAHQLKHFADNSLDLVWSLESCEQFYNKAAFIQQSYRVLKSGGKLLLVTWCSDSEFYEGNEAKEYRDLCKTYLVPYMPTINYYRKLLAQYFHILKIEDWSPYIKQSWQNGISTLNSYSNFQLLKLGGLKGLFYIKKLPLLQKAFETGKIRYGVFVVQKVY
jgi:tocopherol O-methyltransferase